jgi:hypothetical protein
MTLAGLHTSGHGVADALSSRHAQHGSREDDVGDIKDAEDGGEQGHGHEGELNQRIAPLTASL